MKIDKKKYSIAEENQYKGKYNKTQIIIASSLRKDNHHLVRLKHKDFGKTKRWNTFTISRDGTVYQHYDPKSYTDFMGIKQADKQSISIVLENMGYLTHTPKGSYVNWLNEICDEGNIFEKKWMGYNFWEKYTNAQMDAVVKLCNKLCDEFEIEKNVIEFKNYHKDILKFKGIVFRSNYFEESVDVNPDISIEKFSEMLNNENS